LSSLIENRDVAISIKHRQIVMKFLRWSCRVRSGQQL